jgi:hypothetical protein
MPCRYISLVVVQSDVFVQDHHSLTYTNCKQAGNLQRCWGPSRNLHLLPSALSITYRTCLVSRHQLTGRSSPSQ